MRSHRRALTRTEKGLLTVLGVLAFAWALEASLTRFYLTPRSELRRDIEDLTVSLQRTRSLQARAAEIQRQYEQLQADGPQKPGEKRSEAAILLEIERLAREGVRLHSLQPKPVMVDGAPMLHLSVEVSSDLAALAAFLQSAVGELGAEVTAMTLTPDGGRDDGPAIRSRVELDVVYDGS